MRTNAGMFWILGGFFTAAAITYTIWGVIYYGHPEFVGTVVLTLTAVLGYFLAFYLHRSWKAQGGELPEDSLYANIDDGDPEVGHFSPWSWWPVMLGTGCALVFLGVAVGFWICAIGLAFTVVCLFGWVYEYYRGYFAR